MIFIYLALAIITNLYTPNVTHQQAPEVSTETKIETQEEAYFQIGEHYYPISTISYIVAIREGSITRSGTFARNNLDHDVCGIKGGSTEEYRFFHTIGEGLKECRERLQSTFERHGVGRGLSIWKNGNKSLTEEEKIATNQYINDIEQMLFRIVYSR